jgi:hypothetical protein
MAGGVCSDWQRFQVLMFATRAQQQQESPLDRQITTPAKPSFTVEFNSLNPPEQGLEDQFFGFSKVKGPRSLFCFCC